jgi:hypothetical protein
MSNDADQSHYRSSDPHEHRYIKKNLYLDKPSDFHFRPNLKTKLKFRLNRTLEQNLTHDDRSSWTDFITQFQIVRLDNSYWSCAIKALQLAACLRGSARSVLTDLRPHQLDHYNELKYKLKFILQTRFEPKNQTDIQRAELDSRYRKRNESLSELAQDIKRLARLAYPTAPCEVRDTLA